MDEREGRVGVLLSPSRAKIVKKLQKAARDRDGRTNKRGAKTGVEKSAKT